MGSPLLALWRTRGILWLLIRRELKVRYASSKYGYIWTILDPLLSCMVFWLVFGVIFAGARDDGVETPYIVFLIAGYLPWMAISGSITDSARSLSSEAKLVRSTNLPRELWLLRVIGAKCCELVLSIPVLLVFMLGFWLAGDPGVGFSKNIVFLPVAFLMMVLPLVGIGLALAPLCVLFKDLIRIVRIVVRLLFYMTPVLYGSSRVTDQFDKEGLTVISHLYFLNPFVAVIDLYRSALYSNPLPSWQDVGLSVGVSSLLLVVGIVIFRRLEGAVLKEI
jgi:ABC-2 type transport system permease protein